MAWVGAAASAIGSLAGMGKSNAPEAPKWARQNMEILGTGAQQELADLNPKTQQFGQMLADQALGKAPSLAELQLKAAQDRNLSQQLAAAKANRAVNPALAARSIQAGANQAALVNAQQAAMARIQEQRQAQDAYNNYVQNLKANSIGAAGQASTSAQNDARIGLDNWNQQRAAATSAGQQLSGLFGAIASGSKKPTNDFSGGGGGKGPMPMNTGGIVPGKAPVEGDSVKNDNVLITASPGEAIIPRTIMDKGEKAAVEFLKKAKQVHEKQSQSSGYAAVLAARAEMEKAVEEINRKHKGGK